LDCSLLPRCRIAFSQPKSGSFYAHPQLTAYSLPVRIREEGLSAHRQEHGYRVLRFLCQDLGANLNHVLDEILRAIASMH